MRGFQEAYPTAVTYISAYVHYLAVTAYNPAVVALTDMLRQQLKLVEQFVDNSRRMYESYTNNLNTTYKYTTLEDTLQVYDPYLIRHTNFRSISTASFSS